MERNANYFLVGLISLILVAVAAVFVAWCVASACAFVVAKVPSYTCIGRTCGIVEVQVITLTSILLGEVRCWYWVHLKRGTVVARETIRQRLSHHFHFVGSLGVEYEYWVWNISLICCFACSEIPQEFHVT